MIVSRPRILALVHHPEVPVLAVDKDAVVAALGGPPERPGRGIEAAVVVDQGTLAVAEAVGGWVVLGAGEARVGALRDQFAVFAEGVWKEEDGED